MKQELLDIKTILTDKEKFKNEIFKRYSAELTSIKDLLGDEDSFSTLFYLINRHFLYMLDNDPSISIKESDINFRRKFYHILKLVAPSMLACKQVIENREYINEPIVENKKTREKNNLSDKPVIYVANHGFRDDALATVIAADRHAYIYWGSLPLFYNTFEGLASSLVGEVVMNRKKSESRKASLDKALKVMEYGTDIIMFSEGGWNKTSEIPVLDLWPGIYKLSCMAQCDVVPIAHYVRDMEILNKNNLIHTVVDNPIPLYQMEEKEALTYLRDNLASWQYKMAELYGKSTRAEEMNGFATGKEKWDNHLTKRMSGVARYDSSIEKKSDYRPKNITRPEEVFRPICNINQDNINAKNIKMIEEAKKLVKTRENNDFQRLY